jgi:DNA-binding NtrC family response regulator
MSVAADIAADRARISVLVVDDDQEVGECIREYLADDGYEVTVCTDPAAALRDVRVGDFHVAIVDLIMPGMDGLDLIEQIRSIDSDVALVVLTGHPSLESASASIERDVSAYLQKPIAYEDFRATMERIARRKGLVRKPENELLKSIGQTIRGLRKSRTLTLKQLSRRTGLSVSLLSQIERAESSASISSLYKVASALEVPLTELFGDY